MAVPAKANPKANYISGLDLITQSVEHYTSRGSIITYSKAFLKNEHKIQDRFVMDCYTRIPHKYTARGFYLQKSPYEQSVLITCLKGCVVVYAVDLRKTSPTFMRYNKFAIENTATTRKDIYIPRGVAYGYVSMEDDTELMLKFDNPIALEFEEVFNFADPNYQMKLQYPDLLGENRPIASLIAENKLIMSARDRSAQWFWEYLEKETEEEAEEKLPETPVVGLEPEFGDPRPVK